MKSTVNRRKFIRNAATGGCALLLASQLKGAQSFARLISSDEENIDPQALNYCGYTCPADCTFLKATKTNDAKLKKEAYEEWNLKEKYDLEFDPEKVFCWGCKVTADKTGPVASKCTVRSCAINKNMEACIQCDELKTCEKDLWQRFPDFHKAMLTVQQNYRAQR